MECNDGNFPDMVFLSSEEKKRRKKILFVC